MQAISKKCRWSVLAVFITFILGGLDWLSGYDLNFFVFYFIPVFLTAWFLSMTGSVFLSIISAMVWFGADVLAGHTYSSNFYAVWNTMIRLVSFLAIGWAVSSLRHAIDIEKEASAKLRISLSEIKVLKSFLPICAQCKKIRNEQGVWEQLEVYISKNVNTEFSHGYCPDCYKQALADAGLLDK